jgi:hypothetical protein
MDKKQIKKKYRASRKGHIQTLIDKWRKDKVKYSDGTLRELCDRYLATNECELCQKDISGNTSKISLRNMDHSHATGYFRWIICRSCNVRLGKRDTNYLLVMNELKLIFNLPPVILKYQL